MTTAKTRKPRIMQTVRTTRHGDMIRALRAALDPVVAGYVVADDPTLARALVDAGLARRVPGRSLLRITDAGRAKASPGV